MHITVTYLGFVQELRYENFRANQPFDFTTRLRVIVTASASQWMGRGRQAFAKWMGDVFVPFQRYRQVVSVSFRPAGLVGVHDVFEAFLNIGVSAAIFGVVKVC